MKLRTLMIAALAAVAKAGARNGRYPDLRAFAGQSLPAPRRPLAEAQTLGHNVGVQ